MLLQDQGLDVISEGLDTLKNMAHDMNEVGCCLLYMLDIVRDYGITSLLYQCRNWTGKSLWLMRLTQRLDVLPLLKSYTFRTKLSFVMHWWVCVLQVDKATADLKNTNVRLKETVNQVPFVLFLNGIYALSTCKLIRFKVLLV